MKCNLKKIIAGIALILLGLLSLTFNASIAWHLSTSDWTWNTGGSFEIPTSWEGTRGENEEFEDIPWGEDYWGLHAYSWWESEIYDLSYFIFANYWSDTILDGHSLVMEGHEKDGRWGTVTCIQGDIWNWKDRFGEKMWNVPLPISTYHVEKDLTIEIDVRRLHSASLAEPGEDDRIMYAINVWLSSPELPLIPDKTPPQNKPLVLDLIFYLGEGDKAQSFADDYAYHYQVELPECPIDPGVDTHVTIPLTAYIYNALSHFDILYAADTLHLYQLEFLLETQRAYAACGIDNFYLTVTEQVKQPTNPYPTKEDYQEFSVRRHLAYDNLWKWGWRDPGLFITGDMLGFFGETIARQLIGDVFSVFLGDTVFPIVNEIFELAEFSDNWFDLRGLVEARARAQDDYQGIFMGGLGRGYEHKFRNDQSVSSRVREIYCQEGFEEDFEHVTYPDFILYELWFMSYLCKQEYISWCNEDIISAREYRILQLDFLDHVEWMIEMCENTKEQSSCQNAPEYWDNILYTTAKTIEKDIEYLRLWEQIVRTDTITDGRINIVDITCVAMRFGLCNPDIAGECPYGAPECYDSFVCYDSTSDFNSDGIINIIDISFVARVFGRNWYWT